MIFTLNSAISKQEANSKIVDVLGFCEASVVTIEVIAVLLCVVLAQNPRR